MAHNSLHRVFLVFVVIILCLNNATLQSAFSLSSFVGSLPSLSPAKIAHDMIDRYCVSGFGGQDADTWIELKAHEFLGYFGVKNAEQVKIRKLEIPASFQINYNLDKVPAITLWTGLWFNQNLDMSEEALWEIAHAVAHFVLNHPAKISLKVKVRPVLVAGAVSALFLAGNTLLLAKKIKTGSFSIKNITTMIAQEMMIGLVQAPIVLHTYVQMIAVGLNAEKDYEKEADVAAAKMLCDYGYASVVCKHLETINQQIEQGVLLFHPYTHPSLAETRDYLQEFWSEWLVVHPEYDGSC